MTVKLSSENQCIKVAGEDAVRILREIELVLVSLHKIGAYYANAESTTEYERETTRFIDEWKVTTRLAEARELLSRHFDSTLGADSMDDLEREMESVDYWSGPQSSPK